MYRLFCLRYRQYLCKICRGARVLENANYLLQKLDSTNSGRVKLFTRCIELLELYRIVRNNRIVRNDRVVRSDRIVRNNRVVRNDRVLRHDRVV